MESILIALFLALVALLGAPLFTIIGAVTLIAFSFTQTDSSIAIVELYRITSESVLIAIPLFTFAGYMLAESQTPKRLINLSRALFGWMPGGLAIVVLVSCAVFTAFTGASGVTIVALGGLMYPVLIQEKYPESFSLGLVTTSGSLGLLFPPSLPLILYAMVASLLSAQSGSFSIVSVNQLFIAGVLPGILLVAALSLYSIRKGISAKVPRIPFAWSNVRKAAMAAAWEIPLPFIIIGGIYGGLFTATEAAAITAFYVLVVEVFVYRDLSLVRDVPRVMRDSMLLVGAIIVIIASALGLTNYLVIEEVPQKLFQIIQAYISSKAVFLILLNFFLLIVGMMMDIFSAIIVVVPLIIPVSRSFGVDPIHLGIIFLTNLEIGYLTPPVGLNLFISSFRFEKSIARVTLATLPYIGILLIALLIITYFPELSLVLIQLFGVR
ncbi:MAG: TRAP transporter large permease subunit [Bacteroidota bacterium]